jgi:rhamnose transport system permease protein
MSQAQGQATVIGVTCLILIVLAWGMKHLAAGRYIYAVGSDAEAARLAGINPKHTTFGVFVSMGVLAAVAAVMNLVQSPQIQPSCGDGLELKAVAAAVVGGIAIRGGRGTLWGVLPGLLLLANVNPALTHFHQPPYWEKAIQGLVIILAVVADGLNQKKNSHS